MMKRAAIFGGLAIAVSACAALADAIDGQWCLGASHFEISGPNIRTLGGNDITGNYDRHGFGYIVPINEAGVEAVQAGELSGKSGNERRRFCS